MYSLKGLGGCQEVGRSAFLLDFGEKFLLDYGLKLNHDNVEYPLDIVENIKAAIISHAHLDHSGYLPYFYNKSDVISFMTQATLEIADILWLDSIKISEFEGLAPKYSKKEVLRTHKFNFVSDYRKKIHLSNENYLEFFDAGHILGSSLVKLNNGEDSFLYTGDFKVEETQLHVGADVNIGKIDYVLIESTYGDREHPDRREVEKKLCESVQETVEKGGWAIIPAFAVGRSQELVDILTGYGVQADIWLDGMGKKVADLYLKHADLIKNPKKLKSGLNKVNWVKGDADRKKILKKPCVIITTSGMMKGGPVVGYAQKLMNDPNSKIHLSGYQAVKTPGRLLQEEGMLPYGPNESNVKVSCQFEKYDLSAHPSQEEMLNVLKKWSPKKIFLIHGDKEVMPVFRKSIEERLGIDTNILELGKKIEFD